MYCMVKIQLELNKQENKIVSLYKVQNDLNTKAEAIKQIIKGVKK